MQQPLHAAILLLLAAPQVLAAAAAQESRFPAQGMHLEHWIPPHELGIDPGEDVYDVWGYTSTTGRDYAIVGLTGSYAFLDVTDPEPVLIGKLDADDHTERLTRTYQNYAYLGDVPKGFNAIVDLEDLNQGLITVVGSFPDEGRHRMFIDEVNGFLYETGGGLWIWDLAQPTAPVLAAHYDPFSIHHVQVHTYASGTYAGRQIAYIGSFDGPSYVLDVTDKANIVQLATMDYPLSELPNEGALSEDLQHYYIVDWENAKFDEPITVHRFDVSDPGQPVYEGSFTNGHLARTSSVLVDGNDLWVTSYVRGLRKWDISDPDQPTETAWFDSFLAYDESTIWAGCVEAYPYFASGRVLIADTHSGLMIVREGPQPLVLDVTSELPEVLDPTGLTLDVTIMESSPGELVPGTEQLVYDDGGGVATIPLQPNGGGSYLATFPAFALGTRVEWYLEARDARGMPWRFPEGGPDETLVRFVSLALLETSVDALEKQGDWISGAPGDDATSGVWEWGDPSPFYEFGQPGDDHSDPGVNCWVTTLAGHQDVDKGRTSLLSPVYDLSLLPDPVIRYWVWYSNHILFAPLEDPFKVGISTDGGLTWQNADTIEGDERYAWGGWHRREIRVRDFSEDTHQVQLRFRARDEGSSSVVDALIDDVSIATLLPSPEIGDRYCSPAVPNSTGQPARLEIVGSADLAQQDLTLIARDLPAKQSGYFLASLTQDFVANPGGSQGNLCLGGNILRFVQYVQSSASEGVLVLSLQPDTFAVSGETWNFSAWYRDKNPSTTSNFTDAVTVQFL